MVCRIKSKNACARTAWGFFVTTSIPCDGITAKRLDTAIQLCSSKLLQMLRRRSLVVPFFASASFSMSSLSLKSEQDSFGSITACIQIRMEGCWPGCGCTRDLIGCRTTKPAPKQFRPPTYPGVLTWPYFCCLHFPYAPFRLVLIVFGFFLSILMSHIWIWWKSIS